MDRDEKSGNGIYKNGESDTNDKVYEAEPTESALESKNDSEIEIVENSSVIPEVETTSPDSEEPGGVNGVSVEAKDKKIDDKKTSTGKDTNLNFVKPERAFKLSIPEEAEVKETSELEVAAQIVTTKTKKSRRPIKTLIYILSILAVSITLAVIILYSLSDLLGMFRSDVNVDVTIPTHATTQQIATILQKNGIIRSALVFEVYVKLTHKQGLQNGMYTLSSQLSYNEIIQELKSSSTDRATARVTIPEGYTLQQIGALMEKDDVCSKQDFLNSANNASIKFDFSAQIPNDPDRFYRLEGYLFPDTYEFYLNQSSDAVVEKMLQNFDVRFDSALRKKAAASGMTVDQIVTLASIIQKEAGEVSQMGKVSSVFHNRLKNGVDGVKMLQSDATILYVTHDIEPILTSSATQLESAYNTYKHEGLPPGAICNPGLDAINAAISPENTNYYFFVTDKSGNYYYAKTFSQHLVNVKKAMKSGGAAGTNVTE